VAWIDLDVKWKGSQATVDSRKSKVESTGLSTFDFRLSTVEWGVAAVRAPEVWARGYTGQGVVIADLDTGVQWDHPGILPAYRGWDGITATHDYNWLDPTGKSSATPSDDRGHGTHTVGTLVGDDGQGNQTGVAPGAQWIGCRNMDSGFGSVALYTACFQFALAPTDVNGQNPDPARAADLTSNSWSCEPPETDCAVPSSLVTPTQALRSAGILVVAAAGNYGAGGCGTVQYAPGTLDQSFTVGAVDAGNNIAYFSSRGPSFFTGRLKPDLVAPGVGVRSTEPPNIYGYKSGTSMATPHVAGVVALLWSAAPWLRGQADETEAILRATARPLTTTSQACGGVPGAQTPNNTFGYGLIDAQAAVSAALDSVRVRAWAPPLAPFAQPITVEIVAINAHRVYTLTGVSLTATLPVSVHVVQVSGGGVVSGGLAVWTLGEMGPATSVTVSVEMTVPAPGVYTISGARLTHAGRADAVASPAVHTLVFQTRRWAPLISGYTATLNVSQANVTSP
jgi:subtilisin family serine protease